MAIRKKEKWRDLGMVFKPSFKWFKNEKIIFIQVILKQECLFHLNMYIYIMVAMEIVPCSM